MSNRLAVIVMCLISLGIMLGIFFTNNYNLFGLLLGFMTGLINIQWLSRDTKKVIDQEKFVALKIYSKSLFSRLGMVTLVVATVGRFRPEWLLFLALGIAGGIIISLILSIRQQIMHGRG